MKDIADNRFQIFIFSIPRSMTQQMSEQATFTPSVPPPCIYDNFSPGISEIPFVASIFVCPINQYIVFVAITMRSRVNSLQDASGPEEHYHAHFDCTNL
jgi:hypothetical protein